jgi:hypothetical protein
MPMTRRLPPNLARTLPQAHAMGYRSDEHKREYLYRPQSTAVSFVAHGTKLVPRSARNIRMKACSVNRRVAQFERQFGASLGQSERLGGSLRNAGRR